MQKMTLLVEIGNARLKWATYDGYRIHLGGVIFHYGAEWHAQFKEQWDALPSPERIVVANVSGEKIAAFLTSWVNHHWQVPLEFKVAERKAHGVVNSYPDPQKLGIDRWMNLLAARQKASGAFCVISCGTCITVDGVNAVGEHQGGWITPSIALLQQSVIQRTPGCAFVDVDFNPHEITLGKNTQENLNHGCLLMAVAFVDHAVKKIKEILGEEVTFFLTGGDATVLAPFLQFSYRHEPDLIFYGLAGPHIPNHS